MCFVAVVNEESHDTSEAHHAAKKTLLSNLIQSVLMSALLEMDTMQTWVHILLGKKIPERGEEGGGAIVRPGACEWRGQTRLIEFAHQPQKTGAYYTCPGFFFC